MRENIENPRIFKALFTTPPKYLHMASSAAITLPANFPTINILQGSTARTFTLPTAGAEYENKVFYFVNTASAAVNLTVAGTAVATVVAQGKMAIVMCVRSSDTVFQWNSMVSA